MFKKLRPNKVDTNYMGYFLHMFHVFFEWLYVSASRLRLGVPHFQTHFRVFIACSKYIVIPMDFGSTCATDHAGRDVWRTSPFDSVEHLGSPPLATWTPRPHKDSGLGPPGPPSDRQRRPGMPSGPYLGMLAASF